MMMRCHDDALPLPRPPAVTARRLWLAVLSLLALLAPTLAGAECVLDGTTVTCAGSDLDGFDAGGTGGLQVDVLPDASVANGGAPGVNTLNLADDNVVAVQAGVAPEADALITASGAGSHGISAGINNEITNSGSIEVSGVDGIGISVGDDNNVTNDGSITVSAAGGTGMAGGNNTNPDIGEISNSGTIVLSGGGNTGAVVGDHARLFNSGTITAQGANSVGLAAGSHDSDLQNVASAEIILQGSGSIGMQAGDESLVVYNGGTITADTPGTTGITGIQVGNENRTLLWNDGTISITGDDGIGIEGLDGNKLENSGTIEVGGASGIGVLLGTAAGPGNDVENSGTITGGSGSGSGISFDPSGSGSSNSLLNRVAGEIDGSASGVAIRGSAGAEKIRNRGIITGDVQLEGGDDTFVFWTGGVVNGDIQGGGGTDTLELQGTGINTLDLSTLSEFEVLSGLSTGTWVLSGSGSFLGGTTVARGTLALDETVNLVGDYVQGWNTRLQVDLDPDGSNDLLAVDGNATIVPGAILELVPTAPLLDPVTYTFLTTTGTLDGTFDVVNFPETGVLSFVQVATSNSLSIEFSRLSYTSAAATANQTATAIYLDDILAAGPTGDMTTVLTSLDTLSTSELQAALDMLHPEAYDAHASAMLSFGRSVAELAVFRRPRCEDVVYERRPEIIASSPCSRGWMLWGSAFGLFGKRDGDSGHIDFDHGGGGMLLGADHPLGEHFLVYGFLGGGYTGVDVDAVGDGHVFSATLGAGARWSLGGTRIHGLLGYARGWHEQERNIGFGEDPWRIARTAKADYGSNLIMALLKAGHTFRFRSLEVEPLATVEYGYLMEESFRESGALDIDLDVDERSNSLLSTTVGARLAYTLFKWEYLGDYLEWADGVWTPELTARWRGNWIGTERDLDARMVGAPAGVSGFTVGGQDAEQGVQVGAGVAFRPLRTLMSIRFDYDGFYGDGSMIHRIGASIRIPLGGSAG